MENEVWEKYDKMGTMGTGAYAHVYKAKNKETGKIYAIKEIVKNDNEDAVKKEAGKMKELKSNNTVCFIDLIETEFHFYIIMEFCLLNLDDYMKIRNEALSIDEIRELLIQLNNAFKLLNEKKLIHRDLKLSNILISIDKINNKPIFKLSDFGLCDTIDENSKTNALGTPLTMAPEVFESGNPSLKSDLWSLGIIIYKLFFMEYPFNGKTKIKINQDIHSNYDKIKVTKDQDLNNLIRQLICIKTEERLSWEQYFNHPFFKNNKKDIKKEEIIEFPKFDFKCKIHSEIIENYCTICKKNFCKKCLDLHLNHKYIPLSQIGITKIEMDKANKLYQDIKFNLEKMEKMKDNIELILNNIKINENNQIIYQNDVENNFKNYYLRCLETIKKKSNIENNINLIDIFNYPKCNERVEVEL